MTAADLVLHGARLLTVAPFKEERPRVGPAAGDGIHATVRATRDASDDQLLTLLRRRIGDAVELGTTTIEVKSGYGLEPDEELRQLRLLARAKADAPIDVAVTYLAAHALPAPYTDDRKRFIRDATNAIAAI